MFIVTLVWDDGESTDYVDGNARTLLAARSYAELVHADCASITVECAS